MNDYVDFKSKKSYKQGYPISCTIRGKDIPLANNSWASLLTGITEYCINKENENVTDLSEKQIYGNKPFPSNEEKSLGIYKVPSDGKLIHTTYYSDQIVKVIGSLCSRCDIDLDDVKIIYSTNDTEQQEIFEDVDIEQDDNIKDDVEVIYSISDTEQQQIFEDVDIEQDDNFKNDAEVFCSNNDTEQQLIFADEDVQQDDNIELEIDQATADIVKKVMAKRFIYGFKNDSIELARFRQYSYDDFDFIISLSNEQLIEYVSSIGIIHNDKVFFIVDEAKNNIKKKIDTLIQNDFEICFYSSFYDKYFSLLDNIGVISEGLLKEILIKLYPYLNYRINYFSTDASINTELFSIKKEILRIWGADIILNYQEISNRLPYIPEEKIRYVLGSQKVFLRKAVGEYSHINKVNLSELDKPDILSKFESIFAIKNFALLNEIPIEYIISNNNNIPKETMQKTIFEKVLSKDYDRRGNIITRKGDKKSVITILKDFCKNKNRCTLQNLYDLSCKLTGKVCHRRALDAGYSVMIRVDNENFVADKYVEFDSNKIDSVINEFIKDDYLPLKDIITFAAFPFCNYRWSLFLLESYCRRFSKQFNFKVLSFNSKNIGVIVRNNCDLTYHQIMTDAVVNSNTELDKKNVIEFLFQNGYLGKRDYVHIEDLINQAKYKKESRG